MCGIAGVATNAHFLNEGELRSNVSRMITMLRHRGPDNDGIWVDAEAGIALGHMRLAILDLSHEGDQPMVSQSGRFIVSYNGEIYNFRDLRRELQEHGQCFRGQSDTEVLLAAVEQWGLDKALRRLVGMFALTLWDRRSRELHLVRDRLGKKPLYFGVIGKHFLFASELKAIHAHSDSILEIDRSALALYLRHACVPAPYSIFRGIFKMPPASRLVLHMDGSDLPQGEELLELIEPYWSAREVAEKGVAQRGTFTDDEAIEELEILLSQAVGERTIADVSHGAFLSGGIDSSTVVALMQKQSICNVKTFTVGQNDNLFDEARSAKRIADYLGTEHHELRVGPDETQTIIRHLPEMYDEPFADQSQVPTFLLSRHARQTVTVALSGDGGDEIFGGYNRYLWAPRIWQGIHRLPMVIRLGLEKLLTAVSPHQWDSLFQRLESVLPQYLRLQLPGYEIHRLASVMTSSSPEALYRRLASRWEDPTSIVPASRELPTIMTEQTGKACLDSFSHLMMLLDTLTFLPDDILTKVDRASMAVSLEVRAPLLDHRVVEFAWRLPLEMKIRNGQGKWILRQVLKRHIPCELFERPKHGFGIPVGAWLRGPLREWSESLLDEARLKNEGFFKPQPVRDKWSEHLSGRRDWGYHLWIILVFQAWQERWIRSPGTSSVVA
jgi:asparagine synthase (glutamine-hydrolysing)